LVLAILEEGIRKGDSVSTFCRGMGGFEFISGVTISIAVLLDTANAEGRGIFLIFLNNLFVLIIQ